MLRTRSKSEGQARPKRGPKPLVPVARIRCFRSPFFHIIFRRISYNHVGVMIRQPLLNAFFLFRRLAPFAVCRACVYPSHRVITVWPTKFRTKQSHTRFAWFTFKSFTSFVRLFRSPTWLWLSFSLFSRCERSIRSGSSHLPSKMWMMCGCWIELRIWISRLIRIRSFGPSTFDFLIVLIATCRAHTMRQKSKK